MEADGDAGGLHPRHGDPVGAAMWEPTGREGGPGDSCKQPVELVLHEGWASRCGLVPKTIPAARGPDTHPGPAQLAGKVGGGAAETASSSSDI